MRKQLPVNTIRPFTLGFENFFRTLDILDDGFFACQTGWASNNYPPHDVIEIGNTYTINMAVAGFKKNEIAIEIEEGLLTISGGHTDDSSNKNPSIEHYRGISKRSFKKVFSISDDMIPDGDAVLEDGILSLSFKKILQEKKVTVINIR